MAARVLLQRHAAPLTASLVAGSMMLYPRAAFAEAPDSYTSTKKPIYDDLDAVPTTATLPPPKAAASPSSSSTTVVPENPASPSLQDVAVHSQQARGPTPTDRLALQIRDARLFLYRHACNAEDALNRAMDRAFNLERSFTDTVAGLAPRPETGEKLMPGLVYVLVAAMAGSMVTRRSNILLRATVPVAFGVGMGWTVLPVTMTNVSELAWRYEQRFPVVAQSHIKTREALASSVKFAEAHRRVVVDAVDEKVKGARETVEDWVKKGK